MLRRLCGLEPSFEDLGRTPFCPCQHPAGPQRPGSSHFLQYNPHQEGRHYITQTLLCPLTHPRAVPRHATHHQQRPHAWSGGFVPTVSREKTVGLQAGFFFCPPLLPCPLHNKLFIPNRCRHNSCADLTAPTNQLAARVSGPTLSLTLPTFLWNERVYHHFGILVRIVQPDWGEPSSYLALCTRLRVVTHVCTPIAAALQVVSSTVLCTVHRASVPLVEGRGN